MKGYYITIVIPDVRSNVNIRKKVKSQVGVLNNYFDVSWIDIGIYRRSIIKKVLDRFPFIQIRRYKYDEALSVIERPDFVYIRRTRADKFYINFLRDIRRKNPNCKIIVEIYTYPYYKDECDKWYNIGLFLKELIYKNRYKKYVDRIATSTQEKEIFGVKTIRMINGINVNDYTTVKPRAIDGEIHIIAVAMFKKHHGYERFIKGLRNYYDNGGERKFKLVLVGEGEEITRYRKLTEDLNLKAYVIFKGLLTGDVLSEVYDNSDIGLGSLGLYKIGVDSISTLKVLDYIARGLPVITGYEEAALSGNNKFLFKCKNDESDIEIEKIVSFYNGLFGRDGEKRDMVVETVRNYAEKVVSIEKVFLPVIDYLKEAKN